MQLKHYSLMLLTLLVVFFTACQEEEYSLPDAKTGLNNDCIKRTLGPNVVGMNLEFAYAMALPQAEGNIISAQVEASIAGAPATYLEHRSFNTNSSGVDVPVIVGSPSVNSGTKTEVVFSVDTCAATLRYFYSIPEEARGKTVSFTFSATASNGQTVTYEMGPYTITNMDMKLDMVVSDNNNAYISIADMAVYNATTAATNAANIDLVYLYRAITGITFNHALVAPTASADYLPGITLPAGVNKSTKMWRVWALRDQHLARLQFGVFIDDLDFQELDFTGAPDYAINLRAEAGAWVETADGKYRAYIYCNSINNTAKTMTVSIKRYLMQ